MQCYKPLMILIAVFISTAIRLKASSSNEPKTLSIIGFTENKGQVRDQENRTREDILFNGAMGNMFFYLKKNGISYQTQKVKSWKALDTLMPMPSFKKGKREIPDSMSIHRVDFIWQNCNELAQIKKDKMCEGFTNYYTTNFPNGLLNVLTYSGITYQNIYAGIDLHYYYQGINLKYDYLVKPFADYRKISIKIEGAIAIKLQKDGSVEIETPFGNIIEAMPIVYQNGEILNSKWVIKNNTLQFDIQGYNPSLPLIIDPLVRNWGTYYGDNGIESGSGCTTDRQNNVYMAGMSNSPINIATSGVHQVNVDNTGYQDAFLVKFSSSGSRQWATYYGGNSIDEGYACAADTSGNVFMTGITSTFGGTVMATQGSYQPTHGGTNNNNDAFLVKFNSLGQRQWATYYGTAGSELGIGCSATSAGEVYLLGSSNANSTVIATPGSHQPFNNGGYDAFLAKFTSAGTRIWATYYGSFSSEIASGISQDGAGNVFICGNAGPSASTEVATFGSHQTVYGGGFIYGDAFLVKFNSAGIRQWGTYMGGEEDDIGFACTTDTVGNVYMGGSSQSTIGIASNAAQQTILSGYSDGFLAKFNALGVRLWSTYCGGPDFESGQGCAIDAFGNIYLAGRTTSTGTAMSTAGSWQTTYGGGSMDAFLTKYDNTGTLLSSTYYGGNSEDRFYGCATDSVGGVYMTGFTEDTYSVMASYGSHQPDFRGVTDAFLARFIDCATPTMTPINANPLSNITICAGNSVTLTTSSSGTITWHNALNPSVVIGIGNTFITPNLSTGTNTFHARINNSCSYGPPLVFTVNVLPLPNITVNSGSICQGDTFTIVPTGALSYTFPNNNYLFTPTAASYYTLTGLSVNGCTSSAVGYVDVLPTPSVTVTSGQICAGQTFTIVSSGAINYLVEGGSWFVSPQTSTTYTVRGFIYECSDVATCSVTVISPVLTVMSTPSISCPGEMITLSVSGAQNYTWTNGINLSSITATPQTSTTYYVIGKDINGCTNSASYMHIVDQCLGYSNTNKSLVEVLIYPNPFTEYLIVDLGSCNDSVKIELNDATGRIVSTYNLTKTTKLFLSDLFKGIYVIKIIRQNQPLLIKKVVRE